MIKLKNKRAQIWVETTIYTLIGLTIIGLVLSFAKPKIDSKKDEIIIDQSLEALSNIESKILEVKQATGNKRIIELKIGKGDLVIDSVSDTISWKIPSRLMYSQEDSPINVGKIKVTTYRPGPWTVE